MAILREMGEAGVPLDGVVYTLVSLFWPVLLVVRVVVVCVLL